ncbi:hypothetical protein STEG23_012551, partial [Scotinomys teguina]
MRFLTEPVKGGLAQLLFLQPVLWGPGRADDPLPLALLLTSHTRSVDIKCRLTVGLVFASHAVLSMCMCAVYCGVWI